MLKEDLYRELKNDEGETISGQVLADKYHVSRAAVWKALKNLIEEGYPIETVGRKGYRLAPGTDLLTADGIRAYLKGPDEPDIRIFRTIDSTNGEAERMLSTGTRRPTLIAAEKQTAGRGHNQSFFDSPAVTGIYMSLLLPLKIPFDHVSEISRAAGNAALRAIGTQPGREIHIEKINDIYDGKTKIGGILCEVISSDLESGCTDSAIIGIGIRMQTFTRHVTRDEMVATATDDLLSSLRPYLTE